MARLYTPWGPVRGYEINNDGHNCSSTADRDSGKSYICAGHQLPFEIESCNVLVFGMNERRGERSLVVVTGYSTH